MTEEQETEQQGQQEPQEPEQKGNREARYRTQLREAEAQRDAVTERLSALQRQTVEGIIERDVRVSPAGVFAARELSDFLNEDGEVDRSRVLEVAGAAATELGLAARPGTPREDPSQGGNGESGNGVTWDSFLKS